MRKMRFAAHLFTSMFVLAFSRLHVTTAKIYDIKNSWNSGFQGEINIPVKEETKYGWKVEIQFHKPIERFECWVGQLETVEQGKLGNKYIYVNFPYNKILEAGSTFKVEFNGAFIGKTGPDVPPVTIKFQNEIIYSEHFSVNNANEATVSTTDIVYVLNSLTKRTTEAPGSRRTNNGFTSNTVNNANRDNNNNNKTPLTNEEINAINEENNRKNEEVSQEEKEEEDNSFMEYDEDEGSGDLPTTPSPGRRPARRTKYPYIRAIHKSLLFYEAQRSGQLPPDNRISWRGDSALMDRGDNGEDLTGGYYDAGDHVKFGYPMAFSITTLAWGIIEYWEAYQQAGELENAIKALKWGVDYIVKAHVGKYEFYGQVGNGKEDHEYWGRPEDMYKKRPAYKITKNKPGTDLAAESSAALSASSLAFERFGQRPYGLASYLRKIRYHAEVLYEFATTYTGRYHESIQDAALYYKSTEYKDEITWAVAWLYRATGKLKYLQEAEGKYQNWGQFMLPIKYLFSWDDKTVGIQVLLSQITRGPKAINYLERATDYCNEMRTNRARYTPKGLLFMDEWSPLRYSANIAFICMMVSDQGGDTTKNFEFVQKQIHYMLGDTGRSYLVGFGRRYPKKPHHRGSSCIPNQNSCGWSAFQSLKPNPIVLEGALVGGPDKKDMYIDDRKNFKSNEVTLDHNSCFQGALAGLLQRSIIGITRPSNRSHEPWYRNQPPTTTPVESQTTTDFKGSASSLSSTVWILYIIKLFSVYFLSTW